MMVSKLRGMAASTAMASALVSGCVFPDVTLGPEGIAPDVTVEFPAVSAATDAASIVIRGRASDPDGVVAVEVAGVAATTADDFATWQAEVTLAPGDNAIAIAAEDGAGARDDRAVELSIWRSAAPVFSVESIIVDEPAGVAVMTDIGGAQVVEMNLATGLRRVVSSVDVGEGTAIGLPRALALDVVGGRALVATLNPPQLLSIDRVSGMRTRIDTGGATMSQPVGVIFDPGNSRAIVLDRGEGALLAIDLVSGFRSVVSGPGAGSGPALISPNGMVHDPGSGRALVVDDGLGAVVAVDLATGARSIVSDDSRGSGPRLIFPGGIDLDGGAGRALVADGETAAVVGVELSTGDRVVVSDDVTGSGPLLRIPLGVTRRNAVGGALVGDSVLNAIVSVTLGDGRREIAGEVTLGVGPTLARPVAAAVDAERGRVLVVDAHLAAVLAVDPATGDRSLVSGGGAGGGAPLVNPLAILVDGGDRGTGAVYVADAGQDAIVAIDPVSGDRTFVSGAGVGAGPGLRGPAGLAMDPDAGRLLVADRELGAVVAVDVATGEREVITGAGRGAGPALSVPESVVIDAARGRVLVGDVATKQVIEVDVGTGDRAVVSIAVAQPRVMALDRDGRLVILDRELGAVVAADLDTLARTVISDSQNGVGPSLSRPEGMAVDAVAGVAVVVSGVSMLTVDLDAGVRAQPDADPMPGQRVMWSGVY